MRLGAAQKVWLIGICMIIFAIGIPISLGLPINRIAEIRRMRPVTPLTPIYYLKIGRENLQKLFVFGDEDMAHFRLTIAQKRINEAQFLRSIGLVMMAGYQKNIAIREMSIGESYLQKLVKKQVDVDYLLKMKYDEETILNSI